MQDGSETGSLNAEQPDPALPVIPAAEARPDQSFRVITDTAYLYYVPGSTRLIVSFDNLASIDTPYPRLPWLYRHIRMLGYSLLGVQSHAKDWFRQETAPALIRQLQTQGFFSAFEKITFTGASMGGFAALNFAPLVPGAGVLAFSPQSTMNREIAPFDARFPWAVRNSNWVGMPFLDAAAAIPYLPHASIVYDPLVPEDRGHAERMASPHVQFLRVPMASHEAVRVVLKSGALPGALRSYTETGRVTSEFWKDYHQRRTVRKWLRALIERSMDRHPRLALHAINRILQDGNYLFASRARSSILAAHPDLSDLTGSDV